MSALCECCVCHVCVCCVYVCACDILERAGTESQEVFAHLSLSGNSAFTFFLRSTTRQCTYSVFYARDKTTKCGKGVRRYSGHFLWRPMSQVSPHPRAFIWRWSLTVDVSECLSVLANSPGAVHFPSQLHRGDGADSPGQAPGTKNDPRP